MNLFFHTLSIFLVFLLHADTQSESAYTKDPCKLHRGGCSDQAKEIKAISENAAEKNQPEEILDPQIMPSLKEWTRLDTVEKGNELLKGYQELTEAHGLPYSPQILTCKAYKESTFNPTAKNPGSSAFGLSQATKSSCKDLFARGDWFIPKVSGFEKIKSGAAYYAKMSGSIIAQMEVGLAILHQKSLDGSLKSLSSTLMAYRGSASAKINRSYAQSIVECGKCIKKASAVTEECLEIARRPETSK
ncbi:MAG: hypothetical protein IPJ71_11905 [Bdellovibrionales bacterium]|nr:hypothetical protein [Bdellovibrionales bacterium]